VKSDLIRIVATQLIFESAMSQTFEYSNGVSIFP